ncbi:hypothetical protein [Nocardia concava]|nr:hypothetical protein [Nocardia concava]
MNLERIATKTPRVSEHWVLVAVLAAVATVLIAAALLAALMPLG